MGVFVRELVGGLLAGALLAVPPLVVDASRRDVFWGVPPQPGGGATTCEGLDVAPDRIDPVDALRVHGDPNVLFVDARPAPDFDVGRIAHAVSLPWSETVRVPDTLLASFQGCKTVVAYCDRERCADSERLAEHLISLGVRQVRVLEGGWLSWYGAGHPVTMGASPP